MLSLAAPSCAYNTKLTRKMMQQAARCYQSAERRVVQRNLQEFLGQLQAVEPPTISAFATELEYTF